MSYANTTEAVEALAAEIGQNVYMDIAKWHLYLSDAHIHTTLAQQLYPLLRQGNLSEDRVQQVLSGISIKLGGGKREVPLIDLLPSQCQANLMEVLEEAQRRL